MPLQFSVNPRSGGGLVSAPGLREATQAEAEAGVILGRYMSPLRVRQAFTVFMPSVREKLSAARTYFVRTDGSNSNNGLTNSAGGAFLTLQGAYDVICSAIDLNGKIVTVQVGDGTYTNTLALNQPWTGGGSVTIQGNSGTPGNVLIRTTSTSCFAITCPLPGTLTLKDMRLENLGSNADGINLNAPGVVRFSNIVFGQSVGNHAISKVGGAFIQAFGNYTIDGGAVCHMLAQGGGQVEAVGRTVTCTGARVFFKFAFANTLGYIDAFSTTYPGSGSFTGQRCQASSNGVVFTNTGLGTINSYFPGNATGTTDSGGQYL